MHAFQISCGCGRFAWSVAASLRMRQVLANITSSIFTSDWLSLSPRAINR